MKILKFLSLFVIAACLFSGCKTDSDSFNDTSFVSSAASVGNLSVMFNITHDNTGVVTIIPNGSSVVSYDVYYGDGTTAPGTIASGKSINHTYAEGTYQC